MKKMMRFVVCLAIGLILNLGLWLVSIVKKTVLFAKTQLVESEQKGDSYLVTVLEKCSMVKTWVMSQVEKQLSVSKETVSNVKRKTVVCCEVLRETRDEVTSSLVLALELLVFKFKNRLTFLELKVGNRIKGTFKMNKLMAVMMGLVFGIILTNTTKFYLFETEAMMYSALVKNLSTIEDLSSVDEITFKQDGDEIIVSLHSDKEALETDEVSKTSKEPELSVLPSVFETLTVDSIKNDSMTELLTTLNEVVINEALTIEVMNSNEVLEETTVNLVVEEEAPVSTEEIVVTSVVVDETIKETPVDNQQGVVVESTKKPEATPAVKEEIADTTQNSQSSTDINEQVDTPIIDSDTVIEDDVSVESNEDFILDPNITNEDLVVGETFFDTTITTSPTEIPILK